MDLLLALHSCIQSWPHPHGGMGGWRRGMYRCRLGNLEYCKNVRFMLCIVLRVVVVVFFFVGI